MSNISWHEPLEMIVPFVFKIKTPSSIGTGFQIFYNEKKNFCGIATADHVIAHEDEWEEPIKIIHHQSNQSLLLKKSDRVIWRFPEKDLAFILFHIGDLPIEPKPLSLINKGHTVKQGVEVGWCGFPAVSIENLCFFAGYISCPIVSEESYLVDGVAINGVSGGPAFYIDHETKQPKFFGVISAYRANRATGEALPGLCIVRSVDSYQSTLEQIKSIDEARDKEEEEKRKLLLEEARIKEEKERQSKEKKKGKK